MFPARQFRTYTRTSHIITGVLIVIYIYSASLRENLLYAGLIQWVVVPSVILSGVVLWQQPRLKKLMKRWGQGGKSDAPATTPEVLS